MEGGIQENKGREMNARQQAAIDRLSAGPNVRTQIWSSGGGVQSTAIAALIVQGKLPKPDLAVISDTERELSTTWDYMDAVTGPALSSVGVTLYRVSK